MTPEDEEFNRVERESKQRKEAVLQALHDENERLGLYKDAYGTTKEQKWIETNRDACAVLRQLHDMLALSSLPPRRTWAGLTDEEIENLCLAVGTEPIEVRLIEAKLKEKNA